MEPEMGAGVRKSDGLSHPALTLIHLRAGFHIWTVCLRLLIAGSLWRDKDMGGERGETKLLTCRVSQSPQPARERNAARQPLLISLLRNSYCRRRLFLLSYLLSYASETKSRKTEV